MDQFSGNGSQRASEDATEAREHVRNAEENRQALEAQKQRTDATAPPEVDQPVRGIDPGGMSASGSVSDDASEAARRAEEAERNRRALEDQNRRVQETTPEEIRDR
ncbi:MAG TPA: hypothetical protein VF771_11330 [Longimicrobiaceae bacterium]